MHRRMYARRHGGTHANGLQIETSIKTGGLSTKMSLKKWSPNRELSQCRLSKNREVSQDLVSIVVSNRDVSQEFSVEKLPHISCQQ